MSHIVVEHIDAPIVMPSCRQLAVGTKVHAKAEAPSTSAACLVCLNNTLGLQIPDHYTSIVRRARQVLLLTVQRNSPHIAAALLLRHSGGNVKVERKVAGGRIAPPDFHITTKADRRCYCAVAAAWGSCDMMCTELVCGEGLRDWKRAGGVGGAVDIYRGGATAGEERGWCCGKGKDVRCVG